MAESVDALVSNTSRFTPVPVRPRLWVQRKRIMYFTLSVFSVFKDFKVLNVLKVFKVLFRFGENAYSFTNS